MIEPMDTAEMGALASLLGDLADHLEDVRVYPSGNAPAARALIAEARAAADRLMEKVRA